MERLIYLSTANRGTIVMADELQPVGELLQSKPGNAIHPRIHGTPSLGCWSALRRQIG